MPASDGARQMQALGARLKALGADSGPAASLGKGRSLRAQLLAAIRTASAPAVQATREAARSTLPKHGGLNDRIADEKITVQTRLGGKAAGVRIGALGGWGANRGVVRHPVFGTGTWVAQDIPAASGWFDSTLTSHRPEIALAVQSAMTAVAEEATQRLFGNLPGM